MARVITSPISVCHQIFLALSFVPSRLRVFAEYARFCKHAGPPSLDQASWCCSWPAMREIPGHHSFLSDVRPMVAAGTFAATRKENRKRHWVRRFFVVPLPP